MFNDVLLLFKGLNLSVSKKYFRLRLESHPDYPSLIAVQDTLEDLGIVCNAFNVPVAKLPEITQPVLVHFDEGNGRVQYFKDGISASKNGQVLSEDWKGNLFIVDPVETFGNEEHDKLLKQEKRVKIFQYVASVILMISAGFLLWNISLPGLIFCLVAMVGIYLSYLIMLKEIGVSNSVSNKICGMARQSKCEEVLLSKGAKVFSWLSWGDVGITYFSSFLLAILLTANKPEAMIFFSSLSIVAIIFPFYSIYYQWRVVKQWCMLCIGILISLGINFITGLTVIYNTTDKIPTLAGSLFTPSFTNISFILLTGLIFCVWKIYKNQSANQLKALTAEIKFLSFKRNTRVFESLLSQQAVSPLNRPSPEDLIYIGNPSASTQLLVACNPYCTPCAKAHAVIEQLHKKFPDRFYLSVRFLIDNLDEKNYKITAVKSILQAVDKDPNVAFKEWYSSMNLKIFQEKYLPSEKDVDPEIRRHYLWSKDSAVKMTPSFFVNGKAIPAEYNWMDFLQILEYQMKG